MSLSNRKLLEVIGEIDGISLESDRKLGTRVLLTVAGREVEVIRDYGTSISHSLTRIGINEVLSRNEKLVSARQLFPRKHSLAKKRVRRTGVTK